MFLAFNNHGEVTPIDIKVEAGHELLGKKLRVNLQDLIIIRFMVLSDSQYGT